MRSILAICMVLIGCSGSPFSEIPEPPPLADGGSDAATTTIDPSVTGGANSTTGGGPALSSTGGSSSATGGGSVLSPTGGAAPTGGSAGCERVVSPNCESPDVQPGDGWSCVVDVAACPSAGFPVKCSHCK